MNLKEILGEEICEMGPFMLLVLLIFGSFVFLIIKSL